MFSALKRLVYLSPDVMEQLVAMREPPVIAVTKLADVTYLP